MKKNTKKTEGGKLIYDFLLPRALNFFYGHEYRSFLLFLLVLLLIYGISSIFSSPVYFSFFKTPILDVNNVRE